MLRRTGASVLAGALPAFFIPMFFLAFAVHADPAFTRAHPVVIAPPDTATPTAPPASTETPAPDATTSPATPAATPTPPATPAPGSAAVTPPSGTTPPAPAAATTPAPTPDATSPSTTPAANEQPSTPPSPDAATNTSPTDSTSPPAAAATAPSPAPVDPIIEAVRSALADDTKLEGVPKADRTALTEFYGAQAAALWVTSDGISGKGKALAAEIGKADDWGLQASAFDIPQITSGQTSPADLADAERRLSIAALKYARYARGGRFNPRDIVRSYDQTPPVRDPKVVMTELAAASAPDAYLRGLHPKHEQFGKLRQVLLDLRKTEKPADPAEAARHVIIPAGAILRPGDEHPNVALLRRRLSVTAEPGQENVYDDALVAAVEAFQSEQGLLTDGIVGGGTRGALNGEIGVKPNKERDIARILVNMERWRWMPEDLGRFYVWDNLPEFMTHVVKDGEEIFSEKIVVGLANWPTPVFSADMKYLVFNPSWGMPDGIKTKELLPRLRRYSNSGGGFFEQMFGGGGPNAADVLRAQDLIVSYKGREIDPNSVDWTQVDIRAFSFVQPPGSRNVLGRVKFMFPNKHDVYMHDTTQKDLFSRTVRNYSHGCMRVQNPRRFAEVLLAEDKGWSAAQVDRYYESSAQAEVRLDKSIPVHVTYFTAVVADDGTVKTYGDIYGHDSRISAALLGKPIHFNAPRGGDDEVAAIESRPSRRQPREQRTRKPRPPQTLADIFSALYGP